MRGRHYRQYGTRVLSREDQHYKRLSRGSIDSLRLFSSLLAFEDATMNELFARRQLPLDVAFSHATCRRQLQRRERTKRATGLHAMTMIAAYDGTNGTSAEKCYPSGVEADSYFSQ